MSWILSGIMRGGTFGTSGQQFNVYTVNVVQVMKTIGMRVELTFLCRQVRNFLRNSLVNVLHLEEHQL